MIAAAGVVDPARYILDLAPVGRTRSLRNACEAPLDGRRIGNGRARRGRLREQQLELIRVGSILR